MLRKPVPFSFFDFTELSSAMKEELYQQGIESNSLIKVRTWDDKIGEYISNLAETQYPGLTQQALAKSDPLFTKLMFEVTMNGLRSRSLHIFSRDMWKVARR
jgi:hypothetical protein